MEDKMHKEVMAVISAALAVYSNESNRKLVVKSIKRVPSRAPVWSAAGRMARLTSEK